MEKDRILDLAILAGIINPDQNIESALRGGEWRSIQRFAILIEDAERERWQKWTCRKEWENVNDPPCHPGDKDWEPCPACIGPTVR